MRGTQITRSLTCESYRVFIKYCFFFKNSRKFATSPSPALGCFWLYKKLKPIGVTVHSHFVIALKVSYNDVGEGGVAV